MPRGRRNNDRYDDQYDDRYESDYDSDYDDDDYDEDYDDDRDPRYDYSEVATDEDDYGVNLASRKKAGRYRIISILFLLLVIAASVGVFMYKQQVAQNRVILCWTTENVVESKVNEYVRTNGLSANPAYVEDVPSVVEALRYQCQDGGTFTWNPVDGTYTCSQHGHYPPEFVTPESSVIDQQTQVIVEE